MCVSSYYYVCVLVLLSVFILLCALVLLYVCPHATTGDARHARVVEGFFS
jgi:hypothetical protein